MGEREEVDYRPIQTRHGKEAEDAILRVLRDDATYTMGDEVKGV